MAPWPSGIAAITLFVANVPAARRFYQNAFGLTPVFEDGDSVVFKIGTTLVNLLMDSAAAELIEPAAVAHRDDGARLQLTIKVEDVDAMCLELAARGVPLLNGPVDRPWGPRTASFMDLDGHVWEIAR